MHNHYCQVCGYKSEKEGEFFKFILVDNESIRVCSKCLIRIGRIQEENQEWR